MGQQVNDTRHLDVCSIQIVWKCIKNLGWKWEMKKKCKLKSM